MFNQKKPIIYIKPHLVNYKLVMPANKVIAKKKLSSKDDIWKLNLRLLRKWVTKDSNK